MSCLEVLVIVTGSLTIIWRYFSCKLLANLFPGAINIAIRLSIFSAVFLASPTKSILLMFLGSFLSANFEGFSEYSAVSPAII